MLSRVMALFPQERRIVIAGAGYAGLHAAAVLAGKIPKNAPVRVTLLSENEFFTDRCRLHELCVRSAKVRYALSPLFARTCVEVERVRLREVDPSLGLVVCDGPSHEYELPFDDLFLATGSAIATYGIPGAAEHAWPLSRFEDAERIRGVFDTLSEGARVIVVGAGLTGVELAAEMAFGAREQGRELSIELVEGAPRILPSAREEAAEYCSQKLGALGVKIRAGCKVIEVRAGALEVGDGGGGKSLPADLLVWCAGIRAQLPGGIGPGNVPGARLAVEDDLSLPGDTRILLGGDVAAFAPPGEKGPLLQKAMWAVQMGEYAGHVLAARALGEEPPKLPGFVNKGELISLGRRDGWGFAKVAGRDQILTGFPAALLKEAALSYHLWAITGRTGVAPLAR